MRRYGVHINGYSRSDDGELRMWLARRSATKQTYPGLLDNLVRPHAALHIDAVPSEVVRKEPLKEASLEVEGLWMHFLFFALMRFMTELPLLAVQLNIEYFSMKKYD